MAPHSLCGVIQAKLIRKYVVLTLLQAQIFTVNISAPSEVGARARLLAKSVNSVFPKLFAISGHYCHCGLHWSSCMEPFSQRLLQLFRSFAVKLQKLSLNCSFKIEEQ